MLHSISLVAAAATRQWSLIGALSLIALAADPAMATPVTFPFDGYVSLVSGDASAIHPAIVQGASVHGVITYESDTEPNAFHSWIGGEGAIYGPLQVPTNSFVIRVGDVLPFGFKPFTFSTDEFFIDVRDQISETQFLPKDEIWFRALLVPIAGGFVADTYFLPLQSTSSTVLSGTELPSVPPTSIDYDYTDRLFIEGCTPAELSGFDCVPRTWRIWVTVTSVSEPNSGLQFAVAGLALLACRIEAHLIRRRIRVRPDLALALVN